MSFQIGTVTLSRNPEQEGVIPFPYRPSQKSQRMEDGEIITYDTGRTFYDLELVFKYVPKAEADSLRDFFKNTVLYKKFTFSLIPPSHYDCGLGEGVQVDNVTLNTNGSSLEGMFSWSGRASYVDIVVSLTYTIQPSASVVDHSGLIVS